MYEGGIKVSTCMVWKGKNKEGSTFDRLSLTIDFFLTICGIAGITISHEIDRGDLLPGIFGKNRNAGDLLVYFMRREGGFYGGLCYYVIRKGKYKLVQNTPYEPFQLFNLEEDPQEKFPLDTDTEHFEILICALFQYIFENWVQSLGKTIYYLFFVSFRIN